MCFFLGHLTLQLFALLASHLQPLRYPLDVEVLEERLEEIAKADNQHREAELIDRQYIQRFVLRGSDKLTLHVDDQGTHRQINENKESQLPHQTQHLRSGCLMLFHRIGGVLKQNDYQEVSSKDYGCFGYR